MQFRPTSNFVHLTLTVLALLALTVMLSNANAAGSEDDTAPDFTLAQRNGPNLRLSEQRGDIVLLNFWASWCGPCRQELPAFEALYQKYAGMGVNVLAVNVDDAPRKAEVLLNDIAVSFPVLFDSSGDISELYQVAAMPTTVMIDRDGKVRLVHKGYQQGDEQKYEMAIKRLLRE